MNKTKNKLWVGMRYIWDHPVILSPLLLILAYLLLNVIRTQAFTPYMNCNYMLGVKLGVNDQGTLLNRTWTSILCEGVDINIGLHLKFNPLGGVLNPILKTVRTITVWAILLFFAFLSLFFTLIINNLKTIVRILTFNREEWKRFGATLSTFLLIFIMFCSIFYFSTI